MNNGHAHHIMLKKVVSLKDQVTNENVVTNGILKHLLQHTIWEPTHNWIILDNIYQEFLQS